MLFIAPSAAYIIIGIVSKFEHVVLQSNDLVGYIWLVFHVRVTKYAKTALKYRIINITGALVSMVPLMSLVALVTDLAVLGACGCAAHCYTQTSLKLWCWLSA